MRLSVTSSAADLNLDTDVEVDIEGQEAISTRWVEWRPDGTTGGKRVFEEQLDTSSPTQYKSKIRIGPGLDVHLRVASRHRFCRAKSLSARYISDHRKAWGCS